MLVLPGDDQCSLRGLEGLPEAAAHHMVEEPGVDFRGGFPLYDDLVGIPQLGVVMRPEGIEPGRLRAHRRLVGFHAVDLENPESALLSRSAPTYILQALLRLVLERPP